MTYIPDAPNIYQGKQVIINSDRLIFNAKDDSILLFSNKAIGFSTNGSFNFDTGNQKNNKFIVNNDDGDAIVRFSTNGNFHFDTDDKENNKFIVNSPNIYLGLDQVTGDLPTEPAVLGNELEIILNEILDLIDDILDDISTKVSYVTSAPGSPTAPNPSNINFLSIRKFEIKNIKDSIEDIKSKNTKLL